MHLQKNGIFHLGLQGNDQVKGVWKRTIEGSRFQFETRFFIPPNQEVLDLTETPVTKLAGFLEKKLEIVKIG